MSKTVLVVAAHPDDEVLGCGGTIAKHVAAGDEVHVVFMADGVGARGGDLNQEAIEREGAMRAAGIVLGTTSTRCLRLPDNQMDSVPLLDIVKALEGVFRKVNPVVVYTHHHGDLNVDHSLTHQAVLTACRPQPGIAVERILSFEVLSSTEWQNPLLAPFTPQIYSDISAFYGTKLAALNEYSQEIRAAPHSRSTENVAALSSYRGHCVGVDKAEAFMLVREVF